MRIHIPPHPGEVLGEHLGGVSVATAAAHLGVRPATLARILNGKGGISTEMALRLAAVLGTSPELWAGMQSQYDLWGASRRPRHRLAPIPQRSGSAAS